MYSKLTMYKLLKLINNTERMLDQINSIEDNQVLTQQLDSLNEELTKRWEADNMRSMREELIKWES